MDCGRHEIVERDILKIEVGLIEVQRDLQILKTKFEVSSAVITNVQDSLKDIKRLSYSILGGLGITFLTLIIQKVFK